MKQVIYRKVPTEIQDEFAELAHGMIDMLVKEDGISTEAAYINVSEYYAVEVSVIKKYIRKYEIRTKIKVNYAAGNVIMFWDADKSKYITRTTLLAQIGNIYKKVGKKLYRIDKNMDPEIIFDTIERLYG